MADTPGPFVCPTLGVSSVMQSITNYESLFRSFILIWYGNGRCVNPLQHFVLGLSPFETSNLHFCSNVVKYKNISIRPSSEPRQRRRPAPKGENAGRLLGVNSTTILGEEPSRVELVWVVPYTGVLIDGI